MNTRPNWPPERCQMMYNESNLYSIFMPRDSTKVGWDLGVFSVLCNGCVGVGVFNKRYSGISLFAILC